MNEELISIENLSYDEGVRYNNITGIIKNFALDNINLKELKKEELIRVLVDFIYFYNRELSLAEIYKEEIYKKKFNKEFISYDLDGERILLIKKDVKLLEKYINSIIISQNKKLLNAFKTDLISYIKSKKVKE